MRPSSFDGGRPLVSRFHVLPASVVLKMPPSLKPGSTRGSFHLRRCRCHAPAYSVFGSFGSIAMIVHACLRADLQRMRPRLAAVGRLVDAAHLVLHPLLARGRHVHDVRIGRMDDDAAGRARIDQTHVLKRPGVVGRLVHADARIRAAEDIRLTGAHPDDVRVGRGDGHSADGCRGLFVEHRLPRLAEIVGRPQATAATAGIEPAG